MDRVGEWRLIDSDDDEDPDAGDPKPPPLAAAQPTTMDRRLVVLVSVVVVALVGVAIWLTLPQPSTRLDLAGAAMATDLFVPGESPSGLIGTPVADILVDIEGAVARPGLHRLPGESRVGDAISAAGGYSPQVDISAAATQLNLAERLVDGAKVHVPARGESTEAAASAPTDAGQAPPVAGGPIDVNHATAEELDTLPGIGPVTAEKVITARSESPFATVDDLLSRGVVGPSTMDKIRDLIVALP